MTGSLYLIDGSSFLYRAYYALPYLSTSRGTPTRVVYGFLVMLKKILLEHKPEHLAVVFDAKGPTFRHAMLESYKMHRPPTPDEIVTQFPLIEEMLSAFRIVTLCKEGVEADDLIASLAVANRDACNVVVVTGDKDLLQLTAQGVTVWNPQKDRFFDAVGATEQMGVRPERIADYLALVGDAVDGVPGVKGIGEKTAVKLLAEYDSLEDILAATDRLPPKTGRLLAEHAAIARLSKELCILRSEPLPDITLPSLAVPEPDRPRLAAFLRQMEFWGMLESFGLGGGATFEPAPVVQVRDIGITPDGMVCALFAEGGVLVTRDGTSVAMVDEDALARLLAEYSALGLALFDGKQAARFCGRHDVSFDRIVDLSVMSYLINTAAKHAHSVEDVINERRGVDVTKLSFPARDLFDTGAETRKLSAILRHVPALAREIEAELGRDARLAQLYRTIEHPLTPVLARMEDRGIRLDTCRLDTLGRELDENLRRMEQAIYAYCGREFNIGSPKQLATVLFDELKLPAPRKGKTGYSTAQDVLDELAPHHPVIALILEYRNVSKLKNTYLDVLPRLVDGAGRVHTTFNQTQTATGRLSSSGPNLQNIPVRHGWGERIRSAFVAGEGCVLVSADYAQIELRLLAELSQDEAMLDDFRQGRDIHAATAARVFGIGEDTVTNDMRRQAKAVNFGIIYGMGAFSLSREIRTTPAEAQKFIDRYFEQYPGVRAYRENLIEQARRDKFVTTLWGRRRAVYEIDASDATVRQNAERIALNTPLQGTAADLVKKAMLDVEAAFAGEGMEARLLLQVHDELLVEAPAAEAGRVAGMLRELMGSVTSFSVPLDVSVGTGANWHEATA